MGRTSWELLQKIEPGSYVTWDGEYEVRMIPWGYGRADAGTWHVGYAPEVDPIRREHVAAGSVNSNKIQVGGGEAIGESVRTMAEARDELQSMREEDEREDTPAAIAAKRILAEERPG